MCHDLVEFVGAVSIAGVGKELKTLMFRGGNEDFNTRVLPDGRSVYREAMRLSSYINSVMYYRYYRYFFNLPVSHHTYKYC